MTAEQALEKAREVLAEFDMAYDTCSRQGLPTEQQEHIAAALLEAYADGMEYGMPDAGAAPSPTFGSSGRPDRIIDAKKLRAEAAKIRGEV